MKSIRCRNLTLRTLGLIAFFCCVHAQQKPYAPPELFDVLPSALEMHAIAIGDRIRVAGKERTMFTGVVQNDRGERTSAQITVQLPRLVRLEGLRPNAPPLIFDGKSPAHPATRLEEQLLEILSSDTTEGMLAAIKDGAAAELVGRRVLASKDDTTELRYDIFEVSGPLRSIAPVRDRLKRYFFDSETGLLAKTQYLDEGFSPPLDVDISFSDWKRQNGSAYPQKIDRRENGHLVFSLILTSIVALPRQDLTSFAQSPQTGLQEE